MRQRKIFYNDDFVGILTETDEGEYLFVYDKASLEWFQQVNITRSVKT